MKEILPSMQLWTDAWHEADQQKLKNIYVSKSLLFPFNKAAIQGNEKIIHFFEKGIGKVDVIFETEDIYTANNLAFEYGIFRDLELNSEKIIGIGKYAITWISKDDQWKILCHTWSLLD